MDNNRDTRNLQELLHGQERPKALQDRVFKKLFDQAEIAQYSPSERSEYEHSVKNYWDYFSTMKTAMKKGLAEGREEGMAEGLAKGRAEGREEGRDEGRAEGIIETARKMKAAGMCIELIVQCTGLSESEVEGL